MNSVLAENPACNPLCSVCHYMRLTYSEQLERKRSWAMEQLRPWGDVLRGIIAAPESERIGYRSKTWLRSFFAPDGRVSFGMYRSIKVDERWKKEFVSWDTCPIHLEAVQKMIPGLRRVFFENAPEFAANLLKGIWLGSPHLVIVSGEKPRGSELDQLGRIDWREVLVPPFDRVWFHANPQVGKKIFGHLAIEPIFGTSQSGVKDEPPIRAFRQVAGSLLVKARDLAVEELLKGTPPQVIDLYCGTGELSLLLPHQLPWLGIEHSEVAVNYANTLRQSRSASHEGFVGGVEQRLRDPEVRVKILHGHALFLNPPRSGLSREAQEAVLDLIKEKVPRCIVYLSCSASSLARDLSIFVGEGFRVELLQPYDFFPQTEHFETLAVLRRK